MKDLSSPPSLRAVPMIDLGEQIPDLPAAFELVEGELVHLPGESRPLIRFHVEGARGESPDTPGVYSVPVRASIEMDGRRVYVAWWAVNGWPKVAAWADQDRREPPAVPAPRPH